MNPLLLALALQCPDGAPPPCRAVPVRAATPDSHVIAVLPFRVTGADTTLSEGVAELLALEYTGEGVQRAADMGSVLRAWRAAGGGSRTPVDLTAARRLATRVGAGHFVSGSIVATGRQLTLSAQVVATGSGAVRLRAGPVRGQADSLPDLLRTLAAQLITTSAGVRPDLAGVPVDALRAFMAGRAHYRRSEWADAGRAFDRALELDSTFAYAALGRLLNDGWSTGLSATDVGRVRRLAWAYRERLDPVNRALVMASIGAHYPRFPLVIEAIEAKVAVTRLAPENADAWMLLGDEYAHRGALVQPDALERARDAFERALALDPGLSEAAVHLSTLGLLTGDLALTRRSSALALRLAPASPWLPTWKLDLAIAEGRGDRVADSLVRVIRETPTAFVGLLHLYQTAIEYADTALIAASIEERERRSSSAAERRGSASIRVRWLMNRGRPAEAEQVLRAVPSADARNLRIVHFLFSAGDSAAAALALRETPAAGDYLASQAEQCLQGQWFARLGDAEGVMRRAAALRASAVDGVDVAAWCAPLLEAQGAVLLRQADARRLAASADSLIALGMPSVQGWEGLALARLWSQLGDDAATLRALRRVEWFGGGRTGSGAHLAERLRLEGQLCSRTGDAAGARLAYRRYLLLRASPEPALVPQRDSVVAELRRLP